MDAADQDREAPDVNPGIELALLRLPGALERQDLTAELLSGAIPRQWVE